MGELQTAMLDDHTAGSLEPETQLSPLHRLREMWIAALADPDPMIDVTVQTCGDLRAIRPLAERQSSTEFALQVDPVPSNVNSYILAVEVKDRAVTLNDLNVAILKARQGSVTELLFTTAPPQIDDAAIAERTAREFGLGINVYQLDIETLLRALLTIAGETSRTHFLTLVGEELNDRVTQPSHKLAWQELLRTL